MFFSYGSFFFPPPIFFSDNSSAPAPSPLTCNFFIPLRSFFLLWFLLFLSCFSHDTILNMATKRDRKTNSKVRDSTHSGMRKEEKQLKLKTKTKKKTEGGNTARRPSPLSLFSSSLPCAVNLLLDVLQPRPDPLQLGLVLVKVHRRGRRERAERERLRRDARVDDLEVCRDRLGPLVGQDSRDGRGPEGPFGRRRECFVFVGRDEEREGSVGEKLSEGRWKVEEEAEVVSDSRWSTAAKARRLCRSSHRNGHSKPFLFCHFPLSPPPHRRL